MAVERTVHEKLEYLTQNTGRRETEVLAEALEQGLDEIYRKHITAAYQAGTMSRKKRWLNSVKTRLRKSITPGTRLPGYQVGDER